VDDNGALFKLILRQPWDHPSSGTSLLRIGGTRNQITYTEDAVLADQLDLAVSRAALRIALCVRLDVAEISDMAVSVRWGTMRLAVRVVCCRDILSAIGLVIRLEREIQDPSGTYSVGPRSCSHWYCRQTGGHGSHAPH